MQELNDKFASSLMQQGTITIEGMEIRLWQGNKGQGVRDGNGWNKIKSYTALNAQCEDHHGHIVFTGLMQIKRSEAAAYAVKMGFKVHQDVFSDTTYVVIGSENVSPTKMADVLRLNNERKKQIKIIDELTFLSLVDEHIIGIPS